MLKQLRDLPGACIPEDVDKTLSSVSARMSAKATSINLEKVDSWTSFLTSHAETVDLAALRRDSGNPFREQKLATIDPKSSKYCSS